MIKLIDKFSRKDLPFNNKMKKSWDDNGYLIISDFYKDIECDKLRSQAQKLIKNYNHDDYVSFFDTKNQNHANDKYFLESGDKIRFFFENKAFDKKGNLNNSIDLVINKIGHALHDLDPVFEKFSKRRDLDQIAKFIGINNPKLLQSMSNFLMEK